MVGQDDLRAVRNEQTAVDPHAGFTQRSHFFQERQWVQHHPVSDDASAARAQHAARNKLENEFLSIDNHGVASVVPTGVARYQRETLGENVDDLALSLIAPVRTDNYCSLPFFQMPTPAGRFHANAKLCCTRGRTLLARAWISWQKLLGI